MAKKFYAVKVGRTPGVYLTWSECEKQVKGFGGAQFKSFPTKGEAEQFVGNTFTKNKVGNEEHLNNTVSSHKSEDGLSAAGSYGADTVVAYIDGSFDKNIGAVGSGGVIFWQGETYEFSFGTKDPAYTEFWNVAGELLAAMYVMTWAQKKQAPSCALYYDYMGIEMWATKAWKANNALTQKYAAFAENMKKEITIIFHKVAAHTGVAYNEKADELAKAGVRKV